MSLMERARSLPEPLRRALRGQLYPQLLAEGCTAPQWHLQASDGRWVRHDRKRYLSRARERIRLLEEILESDDRIDDAERDAAWDVESLKQDFGGR